MAGSPKFKVYDASGQYVAAVKEVELGACLVAMLGNGSSIRYGHKLVVWHEGREAYPAAESYDYVSKAAWARIDYHEGAR